VAVDFSCRPSIINALALPAEKFTERQPAASPSAAAATPGRLRRIAGRPRGSIPQRYCEAALLRVKIADGRLRRELRDVLVTTLFRHGDASSQMSGPPKQIGAVRRWRRTYLLRAAVS